MTRRTRFPSGTIGAFIRIRSARPDRRALPDVAVAGPLAGFALTLPALIFAWSRSSIVRASDGAGVTLGDSLVTAVRAAWVGPAVPEGYDLLLDPAAYAGWVGAVASARNLLPAGRPDGGHNRLRAGA